MMMSITGKNKTFTLIEMIMTVIVLSTGLLIIYEAIFVSLDALERSSELLWSQLIAEERFWEAEQYLKETKTVRPQDIGSFTADIKIFPWRISSRRKSASGNLYQLDFYAYKLGGRKIDSISKYIYYKPEEDEK